MRANPGLDITLNVCNKMPLGITLDRTLCKVRFRIGTQVLPASDTFYLRRTAIPASREVNMTLSADITERRIIELDQKLE